MIWLGARWGGASTPIIMAILFRFMDWRAAFLVLSGIGAVWAVAFRRWFPRRVKTVSAVPPVATPWGRFLRSKTVWLLCGQYFVLVFPWNFLVTWAPAFIDERYHPTVAQGAVLKLLPLFLGGVGAIAGGLLSAPLARRLGTTGRARKTMACLGFAGASLFLVLAASQRSAIAGVGAVAMSSLCNDLVMPTAWETAAGVAGRWSGTISGLMNMVGNLGGALFGFTAAVILEATHHDWNQVLFLNAAMYATGVLLWLVLDAEREI
jgi:predicted MFS family arabinose efflux permease